MRAFWLLPALLFPLAASADPPAEHPTQVRLSISRWRVDEAALQRTLPTLSGDRTRGELRAAIVDARQLTAFTAKKPVNRMQITTMDTVPARISEGWEKKASTSMTFTPTVSAGSSVTLAVSLAKHSLGKPVGEPLEAGHRLEPGAVLLIIPAPGVALLVKPEVLSEASAPALQK